MDGKRDPCAVEAGEASVMRRDLWWEVPSVGLCTSLFGMWAYELGRSSAPWWVVLVAIFGASLVTDLVSGLVHWTWDSWGSERWPIVGRVFIRPFREHHVDPLAITRHDIFEVTGASAILTVPVFGLAWWLARSESHVVLFVSSFLGAAAALMVVTNQIHKWAHGDPPSWLRFLQRLGIVIGKDAHAQHHEHPFTNAYCITHGWWNPLLDRLAVFRSLERIVTRLTGAVPRQEDGTLAKDDDGAAEVLPGPESGSS